MRTAVSIFYNGFLVESIARAYTNSGFGVESIALNSFMLCKSMLFHALNSRQLIYAIQINENHAPNSRYLIFVDENPMKINTGQ